MSDTVPFFVSKFDKKSISLLIRECFGAQFPDISQKRQVQYLINYLQKLNGQTVLCETNYIDRDYLNDHQKYYVTCFNNYSTKCARLHFFSDEFSHDDILNWIQTNNTAKINNLKSNYLGFSVIKPLPVTFLGRTCLKHYDSNKQRYYLEKVHTANLFGIDFEVKSIAFQEQDKVVAACATTALWSLMHATKHLYYKNVPSPSEITLNAIGSEAFNINGFPNEGLSDEQVLKALESFKLKQHDLNINTEKTLSLEIINQYIQDHLDSEIPILAGVSVFEKKEKTYVYQGDHAITILGYGLDNTQLKALYIHDDRVGPFVKAELIQLGFESDIEKTSNLEFHYSLKVDGHQTEEVITLNNIKTCNYHKVRIPYNLIKGVCLTLNETIEQALENNQVPIQISHKIQLLQSKNLKKDLLNSPDIENKTEVILQNWPNYIWNCSFFLKENNTNAEWCHAFDLIYDTTDIPLGKELLTIIKRHSSVSDILNLLKIVYKSLDDPYRSATDIENSFFYSTLRTLLNQSHTYLGKLDSIFGPLRPPVRLDDHEIAEVDIKQTPSEEYINLSISNPQKLDEQFSRIGSNKLIWLISRYGTLRIGEDNGHPTLINAAPARIAGELIKMEDGRFKINGKSGRYSANYKSDKKDQYLINALHKFVSIFPNEDFWLETFDDDTKRKSKVLPLQDLQPNSQ